MRGCNSHGEALKRALDWAQKANGKYVMIQDMH